MGKISEIEKRTDHLGNVFLSEKSMCKKWNVHIATYRNRIKRGLSKEEALTGNIKRSKEDIERCTDHKGNIFETEAAMCRQWNVLQSIYFDRIKRGLSKEEALTGNIKRSKEDIERCMDHEGNVFNSVTAMCRHWNVDFCTYKQRINKRWSKEEALTGIRKYSDEELERRTDHEGNIFETESDMCEYWKLPLTSYIGRLKLGWSKEEALTGIKNRSQEDVERCTDHEGNIFSSERAMCRQWNIDLGCYRSRIKKGLTKEEALTGNIKRSKEDIERCTDHEGNIFDYESAMCKYWSVSVSTYTGRIKRGYSKKEALTGIREHSDEELERRTDHKGNIFDSESAMCKKWEVQQRMYLYRINAGWSKEEALTGIRNRSEEDIERCTDHEGNIFDSEAAMCEYWKIPISTYFNRIKRGCSKKEALTLINSIERRTDHEGNIFETGIAMCKYWNITFDTYRSRIKRGWSKEEALTIPKNMYRGEKRIIDALEKRNISYLHDMSLQKALKFLSLEIDYAAFIEEFQKILKEERGLDWSISKIKRIRPDFIIYKENDKITGVIEHDGEQHQCYVEFFFKTIERFLERNEADYIKNNLWEYLNIPMLRTRDDQIDIIEEMVDDFLEHPENYITRHNTYLSEEEYWAPLIENYGNLNVAFSF